LNRAERIEKLKDEERWTEGASPYGLPKIAHRKVSVGGKSKKAEKTEDDAQTEAAPQGT